MIQKVKLGEKRSVFGASASTLGGTCPRCEKLYAIVGRIHRCEPAKSTRSDVTVAETSGSTSITTDQTSNQTCMPSVSAVKPKERFDRSTYQRNYMREYMRKYLPAWRKKRKDKVP
jgi:hypothetical protein